MQEESDLCLFHKACISFHMAGKCPIRVQIFSKHILLERTHYRHCEKGIEIVYIRNFTGYAVIGGKRYDDLSDSVLILNSCETGEMHVLSEEQLDAIHVRIPYYFLREIIPNIEYYYFIVTEKDEIIKKIVIEMGKEQKENSCCSGIKIMGFTYLLLHELMKRCAVKHTVLLEERVWDRTILGYIEENLKQIGSVEEIAQHFFYSKEAFSRRFHERMGISCQQYLLQKRLQYAIRLLLHTDMSYERIWQECGFKSIRAFQENFYKVYRQLPEKFRS